MKSKLFIPITLCAMLMASSLPAYAQAQAQDSPRDIQLHWAGAAVHTLMESGVVKGYPNGRFRPDQPVTREQAASMLDSYIKMEASRHEEPQDTADPPLGQPEVGDQSNEFNEPFESNDQNQTDASYALDEANESSPSDELSQPEAPGPSPSEVETPPAPVPSFTDMENRWSLNAVTALAGQGILTGYPDGTFRPTETLTRGSLAVMIQNYRSRLSQGAGDEAPLQGLGQTQVLSFPDLSGSYAKEAVEALCLEGILKGYPDGTFRPEKTVTRGEMASVLMAMTGESPVPPAVTLPSKKVIEVPYISQVSPVSAPVGCEATSLLMGLKGKGYAEDVNLREFLDAMPRHSSNPAKGFVGSPYKADKEKKTRTTIYPEKLAEFGSRYGKVTDFSGSSPQELQAEVLYGNPVVVYITLWWEKPFYRWYDIEGQKQRLLSNNHAVLVCGYDREKHAYYIADPYNIKDPSKELKYWISESTFDPLYNERRHAVVIE